MGKASRQERNVKIRVDDAARLITTLDVVASWGSTPPSPRRDRQVDRWVGQIAQSILGRWNGSRVVLRADADLVQALLDSDLDAELPDGWNRRLPFGSFAVSLTEPVELTDATGRTCRYLGFAVAGIRHGPTPPAGATRWLAAPPTGPQPSELTYTTYHDVDDAEGLRCMWAFVDTDGIPGAETVTIQLARDAQEMTVADIVENATGGHRAIGSTGVADIATLGPISILALLYLASTEPDFDRPAPEKISRPQQLGRADIVNLGWRVGAAIRAHRDASPGDREARTGGWSLPPHIRSAHFRRARIATRDTLGVIVGNVHGTEGADWHYELRWIPPTPVNVGDAGPAAAVRDLRAP